MITLTGEQGGGQILRSALSLSVVTGQAFRLTRIRGKRPKPGLMRQHLTCVKAAVEVSDGSVDGAEIGSQEIVFRPGVVKGAEYRFAIGTAGSTTLLAQTLLPMFWGAEGSTRLILEGGTHNPMAPPMDFITRLYLPMLERMGVTVSGTLERHGFAPAGGGRVAFEVLGGQLPRRLVLLERGTEKECLVSCLSASVSEAVAEKETKALLRKLAWTGATVSIEEVDADGSGNVLSAEVAFEHVTERVSAHGAYGKRSAVVAAEAARMMQDYLGSGAVVGRRLADQLLLPMALGSGGEMVTMAPSNHVVTNAELIQKFLPVEITTEDLGRGQWRIVVS